MSLEGNALVEESGLSVEFLRKPEQWVSLEFGDQILPLTRAASREDVAPDPGRSRLGGAESGRTTLSEPVAVLACSADILRALQDCNHPLQARGARPSQIRFGLSAGSAVPGNLVSERRYAAHRHRRRGPPRRPAGGTRAR